jgi:hypothetical protein
MPPTMNKAVLFYFMLQVAILARGQADIGFRGGLNLAVMQQENDILDISEQLNYRLSPGFNLGPVATFGLGKWLTLEAALLLETKGAKGSIHVFADNDLSFNTWTLYLDVPVLIKAGMQAGPFEIFAVAGPYAGFGITGKIKASGGGESRSHDIVWGSDSDSDFRRMDYGAIMGAGMRFRNISFGGYFSLGIANIASPGGGVLAEIAGTEDGGFVVRHRVVSIAVTYMFGKGKQ